MSKRLDTPQGELMVHEVRGEKHVRIKGGKTAPGNTKASKSTVKAQARPSSRKAAIGHAIDLIVRTYKPALKELEKY